MRNVVIAAGVDSHTLRHIVTPGSPIVNFNFEAAWQGRIIRKVERLLGSNVFRYAPEDFTFETVKLIAQWIFREMGNLDECRIKAILVNPTNHEVRANFVCTVLQAYVAYHKEINTFPIPPHDYAA